MNPGQLDHRITFQIPVEAENEDGQTNMPMTDYMTVWASIKPLRGKAYAEAKKIRPQLTYKITTRYSNKLFKGYEENQGMTIKYKNRVFNIEDAINPGESDITIEFVCTENVEARNNGTQI